MVDLTQSFKHLSTLNDLSVVALATGMVNKTHTCSFINIVSIEAGAGPEGAHSKELAKLSAD